VGHVIFGNALQTSSDAMYLARHAALQAGLPEEVPALTVNRLCGSGFQAVTQGAQEILLGAAEVVLCGGSESMSQAPHILRGARWGDLRLGDVGGALEDALWSGLRDSHCGLTMAETAEELAHRYGVTRDQADGVALRSQERTERARQSGAFLEELVPLTISERRGERTISADEHPRPDTTAEALAALRPSVRPDGVVTAGNASGIGDGAAALVLASGAWARAQGLRPLGRVLGWHYAGVAPRFMGIGPVPAIRGVLQRGGLSLEELALVEVNEAFAAQYLAVERELGLDPERTNVDGGAIALSHPLAASGARITLHLIHALRRRGGGLGVGAACIGGGQGAAILLEAFPA